MLCVLKFNICYFNKLVKVEERVTSEVSAFRKTQLVFILLVEKTY